MSDPNESGNNHTNNNSSKTHCIEMTHFPKASEKEPDETTVTVTNTSTNPWRELFEDNTQNPTETDQSHPLVSPEPDETTTTTTNTNPWRAFFGDNTTNPIESDQTHSILTPLSEEARYPLGRVLEVEFPETYTYKTPWIWELSFKKRCVGDASAQPKSEEVKKN